LEHAGAQHDIEAVGIERQPVGRQLDLAAPLRCRRIDINVAAMRVIAEPDHALDQLAGAAAEIEHADRPGAATGRDVADGAIEERGRLRNVFGSFHQWCPAAIFSLYIGHEATAPGCSGWRGSPLPGMLDLMTSTTDIAAGRFSFGANWSDYADRITDARIA